MASQADGDSSKDKIVRDMLSDFKLSSDAESDNRDRAVYILDFIRPGADQWDSDSVKARGHRPSYSFNQLPKFGRQVINDMWQNVPQIKYIPKGDTNKDKAEILEDKIREVQASGAAQTAYKLAIKSQVNIGWAYFAFGTAYDNDKDFDQNIVVRQIPNTLQVYDDPATREQDRSDRRFIIEIEDVPRSEFNKDHDKDYTQSELVSIGSDYPSWASLGKDIVRIGHYWRIETTTSQLWQHKKTGKIVEDKPKDKSSYNVRDVKNKKVMYYKCTALDKLEEQEWLGSHIPFCFVEGNKEIVDGKTYYTGIYDDMVSTQILYNYATNTAIELAESAPLSPWTGDYRAFEGFEDYYDNANTKNYSRLPYRTLAEDGSQIQAPQRTQNATDLSAAVQLIQMAEQNFYGTSGIYAASLGQPSNEKSGKAIQARKVEGDTSTSNYPDAFNRALLYGGEIFKDLSKKVLDGKRTIQVMSQDKKVRDVKINQKYTDETTGKPMNYDLTEGDYEVQIDTGPSYETGRQEARDAQIQLFQAAPEAMLPALPGIIRNMDWPGADDTADAVERGLPPQLQDPKRQAEKMKGMPPEAQAQLQQAGQMIQQLGQKLQQAEAAAQNKQAEDQAKLMDAQAKVQNAQTDAAKQQAEANYKMLELQFRREEEAAKVQIEQERIKLDWAKLQLTGATNGEQVQPIPEQQPNTLPANLGPNAIQGHAMDLQAQQQSDAAKMQQDQQNSDTQSQLKVTELQQQQQNAQAMMQMVTGLVQSVNHLTQAVTIPKTAIKAANGEWIVAPVSQTLN